MERRKALQNIIMGTGTFFVLPAALVSCEKDDGPGDVNGNNGGDKIEVNMDEARYSGLLTTGGFVVVSDIIVANVGNNEFVALSSVCTHQGCTISYDSGNTNFPCPCHGSVFNTNGGVVNGPALTALKKYNVSRTGNTLFIS